MADDAERHETMRQINALANERLDLWRRGSGDSSRIGEINRELAALWDRRRWLEAVAAAETDIDISGATVKSALGDWVGQPLAEW